MKEYGKEYRKEYRQRPENKERRKKYIEEYRKEYYQRPETKRMERAHNQKRRSLKRAAYVFGSNMLQWLQGQEMICFYCGKPVEDFHIDHIIPLSRGGAHCEGNWVVTCPQCNLSKNAKTAHEFMPDKFLHEVGIKVKAATAQIRMVI